MSFTEAIEAKFDVHHTEGDEVVCRCPWHEDTGRPNLYVNSESGLYICFACGAKGKLDGKDVAPDHRLHRLKQRLRKREDEQVAKVYPEEWLNQFLPHDYWTDVRHFSQQTVDRFRLGYDPRTDRLTIPIRSANSQVLGVIYRRLDNVKPKYLHPTGFQTGRNLFGAHLLGNQRKVALVEGPLDAVACWDAGVPAVAAYGARLTDGQAALVRKLGITSLVVMTDKDIPGREAVTQVKGALKGVSVLVGEYEPHWAGKDPGELSRTQRKQMFHTATPYHVWKRRQ